MNFHLPSKPIPTLQASNKHPSRICGLNGGSEYTLLAGTCPSIGGADGVQSIRATLYLCDPDPWETVQEVKRSSKG